MTKLSKEEIQNIGQLLLSPDERNIALGLSLLEHNQYAIPPIRNEVEVFLGFNPNENKLLEWTKATIPNFKLESNPVYIFALARNYELTKKYKILFTEFLAKDEIYEPLISLDPERSKAYAMLGERIHEEWGMEKMKTFFLRKALKYHPNDAKMHWDLAYHLNYNAKVTNFETVVDEIEEHYLKCHDIKPFAKPLYALAFFYKEHLKDAKKAEDAHCFALEKYPDDMHLLNSYAMLLLDNHRYKEALEYAQRAEKSIIKQNLKKGIEHVYDTLAYAYWKGFDDIKRAETYFDKAVTIFKTHKPSLEGAIEMFKETKNWTKMIQWKERLLATNKHNIMLLVELAQDYTAQHNTTKAKQYYQKALDIHPHYNIALDGLAALED